MNTPVSPESIKDKILKYYKNNADTIDDVSAIIYYVKQKIKTCIHPVLLNKKTFRSDPLKIIKTEYFLCTDYVVS